MNWFYGCRLGYPQGLREQHPSGIQQESTFSSTHILYLYMFYVQFFMTNPYQLVLRMSESTRSPSGTLRATSWWCTAGFCFHIYNYILYMFYAQFFMKNPYKLVLRMSESTKAPSGTLTATSWWCTTGFYLRHNPLHIIYVLCLVCHDKSA